MKNRFTTLDLRATISELQNRFQGMRVLNVYDVDSKTYLFKLAKPDLKAMILMESGIRIHSTDFEWPKNITPSSFSMKLRKHLRTRRLEKVTQLGIDRIVDMQFGSNEAAYHVILELYDRGNIVLTDFEYNILNILRPRTDPNEEARFAVHEKYPVQSAKQPEGLISQEKLMSIILSAKEGDNLKKCLNPNFVYGPALIEHCLLDTGIPSNARIGMEFSVAEDMPKLMKALEIAEKFFHDSKDPCKGYIMQKKDKKATLKPDEQPEEILTYADFQPFLFKQNENQSYVEFDSFDKTADEYFSKIGSQKLDMKTLHQERAALKKLDHIKRDHSKRLEGLKQEQDTDMAKAQLVEMNLDLVDRAILVVRSAIANQIDWDEIDTIVKEAQAQGDPVASSIKSLKLDTNHITVLLRSPYLDSDEEGDDTDPEFVRPLRVDIDLGLTAYANARKFYDKKRKAAVKEQKTMDVSTKALKSAERKTLQSLKEVQTIASINKARKTYWFEKFLWFISSENFEVIGGRDQQQNEYIVKKYLRPGDLYVHADLHGASSVIIKNPTGEPVPPKTLNEAGTMALCYSAAWNAKVVTSAWWVHHHQVSKTAPSGEYLTTGSFMIRGKKNFLPPSYLVYGFGFLFKVDEDSVFRHKGERRARGLEDDQASMTDTTEQSDDVQELDDISGGNSDDSEHEVDGIEAVEDAQSAASAENPHSKAMDSGELDIDDAGSEISEEQRIQSASTTSSEVAPDAETEARTASDDENQFPDTNIGLQYIHGDRLQLQVSRTTSRSDSTESTEVAADRVKQKGHRLSAKERRDMKKKARHAEMKKEAPDTEETKEESAAGEALVTEDEKPDIAKDEEPPQQQEKQVRQQPQQQPQQQQQPLKRRQKAKLKKMEKYMDQDEEERKLRMEILASAGAQKESKKKVKKGKQQSGSARGQTSQLQGKQHPMRKLTIEDIKEEGPTLDADDEKSIRGTAAMKTEAADEDALSDDEKTALLEGENIQLAQDLNELDSLTGIPVPDDILHFCIPVCAPYSAILNYKYRVKITPGNTKRGKAAKMSVHAFQHDKGTTNREKELFKSLKDVDLSRNIPGKVKVSAPNLLKQKKK